MYMPYGYNPYMPPPVYGPMQGGNMTLDDIEKSLSTLKRIKKDMQEEENEKKKKEPPKPKAPTFTFGQVLGLMAFFGPIVGFCYLYTLQILIQSLSELVK